MTKKLNESIFGSNRIHLYVIAIGILILSFFIIKPLITPILFALILAYLFYPLYDRLQKRWNTKNKSILSSINAFIMLLLIVIIILLPLGLLLFLLFANFRGISIFLKAMTPQLSAWSSQVVLLFNQYFPERIDFNLDMSALFSSLSFQLIKLLQNIFSQVPILVFGSFITLFIIYYLLKNSSEIVDHATKWFPFDQNIKEKSIHRFNQLTRGLIVSQFLIAVIQGMLMGIACLILGMHHFIILTLLTMVLAFIPFMGAFIIWFPVGLYLLYLYMNGLTPLWHPIFMFAYGFTLIHMVDNIVRPLILSESTNTNPAVMLVGFVGGVLLFGIPGIVLGPLLLMLAELAIEFFMAE
jgi:predicted PurR-regulated permease PerM